MTPPKPPRKPRAITETGVMPRVDLARPEVTPHEPPHPPNLPEMPDANGTTGNTPAVPDLPEWTDAAKDADEPSASART